MGFDCTLHLVDEKAIREEFIPRLLRRSRNETAFDRVMENAPKLWKTVRKALKGRDPEAAASLVCQLAVMFSACSLPHQYERGFALSLWQDQSKNIAVRFPEKFAFSPEPLFAEVVATYPKLRGHFPTWFTSNYSTGVFIPSQHVPEVLAWIEERVAGFSKGDRRQFKGLLRILRAAAAKRLAYWEATDLAIPMFNQYPGDPDLMIAGFLGNEPGTLSRQVEEAPLTAYSGFFGCSLLDHWLISASLNPFETSFWNLSVWPPRREYTLPEFAPYQAHSRDGRWLLFSHTEPKTQRRSFRPCLFSDLGKKPDGVFPVLIDGRELSVSAGGFVRDRLLVFRDPPGNAKIGDVLPPPMWLEGEEWKPAPGLSAVEARPSVVRGMVENPAVGLVRLADGNDVVVWDGDGYELQGHRFVKTFALEAKPSHIHWTAEPAGTDGFFFLSDRCLFEVHRNGTATPHVPQWTNIMSVGSGPLDSLLLKEGDNQDGDVAKLYFPTEGTFIHIEPELFDDKDYHFIHWNKAADRFIVIEGQFLSVRTDVVLALPRYHVNTGRRVKE